MAFFKKQQPEPAVEAEHYIICARPPVWGTSQDVINLILDANNCVLGTASTTFNVDARARDSSYVEAQIKHHSHRTGRDVDESRTRVITFSGKITGIIVAVFYKNG